MIRNINKKKYSKINYKIIYLTILILFFISIFNEFAIAQKTNYQYFDFDKDTGTITDYNLEGGANVVIPFEIEGVIVKIIGDAAFRGKNLNSVEIPNSVIEIERSAFNTNNLNSVVIPASVEEIEMSAFTNNNLRSIKINSSNIEFSKYSFPEGVKEIYEDNNQAAGSYLYKNNKWNIAQRNTKVKKLKSDSADLIYSVESLQKKVFDKIEKDVEFTSSSFLKVKNYRKDKIWYDIFNLPLKILQNTLSISSELYNIKDFIYNTNKQAQIADSGFKLYTLTQVVNGVKDAGENLGYSLTLPYITKVEKMLEEAEKNDDFWADSDENDYIKTIEKYLNGDGEISVVSVPRKSIDIPRKTVGYRDGVIEVYSEIGDIFLRLRKFINENEIENELKEELIVDTKNLERQIVGAMSENKEIIYPIYREGKVDFYEVELGVPAENNKLLGALGNKLGEDLSIEQTIIVKSMLDTFNDAVNLFSSKLKIDNKVFEVSQKTYSVTGIVLDSQLKTNPDIEKMYYELPQKNLLSLPTELSLLWMVVEDFDNYIRKRVLANEGGSIVEKNKIAQEIEDDSLENYDNTSFIDDFKSVVAVIMDVSGSMNSQSKLGSAKKAIKTFIDSQNEEYHVSLASYSTQAESIVNPVLIAMGDNKLRRGVDFLSASGDTNIGSGLKVGLDQIFSLNSNPENSRMILLSDGRHNTGKLWPVVEECRAKGIKVDTVAFGSDADYDTLYKIAKMTGGRALKAGNKNLSYIYHRISNQIQNYSTLFASKDFIKPGQELNYLINVDSGIEILKFYTNWQTNRISMELVDPDGNKIIPDRNSVKYIEKATYNIYEINAKPGQWQLNIIGRQLPNQGEQVNVSVSGRSKFYTNFLTFEPKYSPGNRVMIGIEVDEVKGLNRIPLEDAKVKVKIHKPSVAIAKKSGNKIEISLGGLLKAATQKKEVEITLYDDGKHNDYRKNDGIFANVFSETDEKGPYLVTGVIEGKLEDGQKIKRQIFETFQVGPIDENELTTSQMTEEIFETFILFE